MFPDEFGAMISIYIMFGTVIVEDINYWLPSSYMITSGTASIGAILFSSCVLYLVFESIGTWLIIAIIGASIAVFCVFQPADSIAWFNSWLPFSLTSTGYILLIIFIGLLFFLLYKIVTQSDHLMWFFSACCIAFVCALAIDILVDFATTADTSQLDILDFDFVFGMIVMGTEIGYFLLCFLSKRYLPPTPCSEGCVKYYKQTKEKEKSSSLSIPSSLSLSQLSAKLSSSKSPSYEPVPSSPVSPSPSSPTSNWKTVNTLGYV